MQATQGERMGRTYSSGIGLYPGEARVMRELYGTAIALLTWRDGTSEEIPGEPSEVKAEVAEWMEQEEFVDGFEVARIG